MNNKQQARQQAAAQHERDTNPFTQQICIYFRELGTILVRAGLHNVDASTDPSNACTPPPCCAVFDDVLLSCVLDCCVSACRFATATVMVAIGCLESTCFSSMRIAVTAAIACLSCSAWFNSHS